MSVRQERFQGPDGRMHTSPTWRIEFRDHLDTRRRISAFTNKRMSEEMERRLLELVSVRSTGATPSADLRRWCEGLKPKWRKKLAAWDLLDARQVAGAAALSTHLDAWSDHLAAKGTKDASRKLTVGRARRTFIACGFGALPEIRAAAIAQHLRELREKSDGISVQTANHYVRAVKQFTAWALRSGLVTTDPLVSLSRQGNAERDRRLERRALSQSELERLVTAALDAPTRHGLTGAERALVYSLVSTTGLRRNEVITLHVGDLDVRDPSNAAVIVRASNAKNGRAARQPLPESVAVGLRALTADRSGPESVFGLSKHWRAADMLRDDLADAGIPFVDDVGRRADFHALRVTFCTNLARSGVALAVAQRLMRHSDPSLTSNVYSVLSPGDQRAAVDALPETNLGSYLGSTAHQQGDALGQPGTVLASNLASPAGLEPATYGLGNRRSIQLSYGDAVRGGSSVERRVGAGEFRMWACTAEVGARTASG